MPNSTGGAAHMAVIEALVAARNATKMTQRDVAERLPAWLGVTHVTLAKIETGRRTLSFVEAREICKVIGTTVAELDRSATELTGSVRTRRRTK